MDVILSGGLLIVPGAPPFVLRLPVGIPLLAAGVPILVRYSPHARVWRAGLGRRLPLKGRDRLP